MTVLAIDPGSEQSAWVLWDGAKVSGHGKTHNEDFRHMLYRDVWPVLCPFVVIEQIASYGMAVGADVFATCRWSGRFEEAAVQSLFMGLSVPMPRKEVKLHLCGQARAKDSNIRCAIIDRFGGKEKAIGRKSNPGPLYGIKADCWQALALAITWTDLHGKTGDK